MNNNTFDNIVTTLAWLATIYGLGAFVYYAFITIKYLFMVILTLL